MTSGCVCDLPNYILWGNTKKIAGQSGRYWQVNNDGITASGDSPEGFYMELREPSKLCIKSADGSYVMAEKNGAFTASSRQSHTATRWEF